MTSVVRPSNDSDDLLAALARRARRLAAIESLSALARALAPLVDEVSRCTFIAFETAGARPRRALYVARGGVEEASAAFHLALGVTGELEVDVESAADASSATVESDAPLVLPIVLDRISGEASDRIGTLVIGRERGAAPAEEFIAAIARELGPAVRVAALVGEAERLRTTDGLTGALNRATFMSALDLEIARAGRFGYTVALLLVGVDRFARVNELRGADAADAVLRGVARVFTQRVRAVDLVARWEGDTFAIALCGSTFDGALTAADRLRAAVEATAFPGYEQPFHVTVSAGVGMVSGNALAAFETAARALAMAKETGRNRVGAVVDSGFPESSLREREWRAVARLAGR